VVFLAIEALVVVVVVVVVVIIVVVVVVVVIIIIVVGCQGAVVPGSTRIPISVAIWTINPETAGVDHSIVHQLAQEVKVFGL